jgi:hypothetical protein
MKTLHLRTKTIEFPECWEDLTTSARLYALELMMKIQQKTISPQKARLLILKKITGYSPSLWHINWPWRPKFTKLDGDMVQLNLLHISEMLDFLFSIDKTTNQVTFHYTMRRNPMPFKFEKREFTIGTVVKTDITAQEFCDAFDAYKLIGHSDEETSKDCISLVCNILNRPPFVLVEGKAVGSSQMFSDLDQFVMLYWFQSICEWIFKHPVYSILFRKPDGDDEKTESSYSVGMDEIIMQLSRSGFDSMTNLQKMTVIDFFDLQVASLRMNVRETIAKGAKKEDIATEMHLSFSQITELIS